MCKPDDTPVIIEIGIVILRNAEIVVLPIWHDGKLIGRISERTRFQDEGQYRIIEKPVDQLLWKVWWRSLDEDDGKDAHGVAICRPVEMYLSGNRWRRRR